MNFEPTDDQRVLRDLMQRFVAKEMPKSLIGEWDEAGEYPLELQKKMAGIGMMGASIPPEYGGMGGGVMEEVIVLEELARHSSTVALAYGLDACFGAVTILQHGTDEQKKDFLPKIASGERHFALSLTEADGGTDILGAMKTVARRDGDDFLINGSKMYTSGLAIATHVFVVARTEQVEGKPSRGLTVFLVPKDLPGMVYKKIDKLGSRFLHSYSVFYEDMRVPKSAVIGEIGMGWRAILDTLNNERIFVAAVCTGLGQGAYEDAVDYARERKAFGRPVGQFQAIQHPLAETLVELDLARYATYRAAWMSDTGRDCSVQATSAKLYASEAAFRATDRGMRVMAGAGFMREYHMQRYYRDIRQLMFAPITNEMCKNFIGQVGCGLPRSY